MVNLELNAEEREILAEALKNYLSDLRYEISDTDRMDFRNNLKRKKAVLEKVVQVLEPQGTAADG